MTDNEILADGIIKKSPKERLEATIGKGMEFYIHGTSTFNILFENRATQLLISLFPFLGDSSINLKKGKNHINKAIGNSIMEHGNIIGHHIDDQISNKSYGSHKHIFKNESHKGSKNSLDNDDHEEKRDASKEELGRRPGKLRFEIKSLLTILF